MNAVAWTGGMLLEAVNLLLPLRKCCEAKAEEHGVHIVRWCKLVAVDSIRRISSSMLLLGRNSDWSICRVTNPVP